MIRQDTPISQKYPRLPDFIRVLTQRYKEKDGTITWYKPLENDEPEYPHHKDILYFGRLYKANPILLDRELKKHGSSLKKCGFFHTNKKRRSGW